MAASAGGVRAGGAYIEIFAKDGAFQQAMARVQKRIQAVGTAMRQAGTSLTMGAAAIGAPMVLAVRQFALFDDAIRATGAVSQASAAQLAMLTERARDLGASTSFSSVQVAQLMTELGRAGFKPDEIDAMTGAVLNLARATGTEASMSAGIMAATLRQFSLGAGQATRVADVLTGAANMSFNTVESLGEALSYAGVTAAQAGMSIEDTAAILGTLGNVGIQGSNAGTALRRLLTITGAEAAKLQEIFGVSFLDAAGNVRPLIDTLGEVAAATNGLPSGERIAKFNEAFGLLGITGASAIAGSVADTRALAAALRDVTGLSAETAKTMDAGVGGSFRKLLSAVQEVGNEFTAGFAPTLQFITDGLTGLAGGLRALLRDFPMLSQIVAGVTGGAFVLGVAMIAGGAAMQVMARGIGAVAAIIRLLPALMTPAGLAVATLVGGIAGVITIMRQMSPEFERETNAIAAALGRLDFRAAWELMNIHFAVAITKVGAAADAGFRALGNTAAAAGSFIGDKLIEGLDRFMGLFGADILTLQGMFERLGVYFRAAFDWSFARDGMQAALAEVDARVNQARSDAPTADDRAAQRRQQRQAEADQRERDADRAAAGWQATLDELEADRRRAMERAEGRAAPAAAAAEEKSAPAGAAGVAVIPAAGKVATGDGAAGIGQTQGTFGTGLGLEIGPELAKMADPQSEIAANTARTAAAAENFVAALSQDKQTPWWASPEEWKADGGATDESLTADQALAELAEFSRSLSAGGGAANPAGAAVARMAGVAAAPATPVPTAAASQAMAGAQSAAATAQATTSMAKRLDAVAVAIQAHAKLTAAGNAILERIAENTANSGVALT